MKKSSKKKLTSIILTISVLVLYLLPNFASAVTVRIQTDKDSYENSEVVKFDVSVDIEDGERVPVQKLILSVNNTLKECTFSPDGSFVSGCDNMNITLKSVFASGYGYGYQHGYGYGYSNGVFDTVNTTFGYGYGYGHGYGYGYGLQFPSELSYTIEWDIGKEKLANGVYEANLEAFAKEGDVEFTYKNKNSVKFTVSGDKLVGDVGDVQSDIPSLGLEIGGSTNLSNVTGTKDVVFKQGTEPLVEFTWDFSSKQLNLGNITLKSSIVNGSNRIVVSGISLPSGVTKTVYLNQTNTTLNSVCVYDHEITSVETLSGDCSYGNETKVECNGVAQNGFTCTKTGTTLKVTGLTHSGLNQISYSVAPSSGSTEPTGTPSAPSGGGGSGYYWQCSEWSECAPTGIQTRTCSLVVSSSGSTTKPEESKTCTYTAPAPTTEEAPTPTAPKTPTPTPVATPSAPTAPTGFAALTGAVISGLTKPSGIAAIIISILVLVGLYAGYYYLYKKKQ